MQWFDVDGFVFFGNVFECVDDQFGKCFDVVFVGQVVEVEGVFDVVQWCDIVDQV